MTLQTIILGTTTIFLLVLLALTMRVLNKTRLTLNKEQQSNRMFIAHCIERSSFPRRYEVRDNVVPEPKETIAMLQKTLKESEEQNVRLMARCVLNHTGPFRPLYAIHKHPKTPDV